MPRRRGKVSRVDEESAFDMNVQPSQPLPAVKPPQPLSLGSNKIEAWRIFKRRWENYSLLTDLPKRKREYQVAMFENCLDDDALQLLNGFSFNSPADSRTVNELIDKFEAFAIGEVN